jgi:DNA-binding transcriptional regulator GbsR (MarR family)
MNLPLMVQTFVLHFGEMGSRWGISRTVGQIYALLFVSDRPLNADDICEHLGFSRSNVSTGLKELQAWNLARLQHLPGDRRDHFATPEDIWEIIRTLALSCIGGERGASRQLKSYRDGIYDAAE